MFNKKEKYMSSQENPKSFLREYKIPIVTAGVIFVLGATTVGASNIAVPGDLLYPVDLKLEEIQGNRINDPQKKLDFKKNVLEERKGEKDEVEGDDEEELDEKIEDLEDEIENDEEELEAPEAPESPESPESQEDNEKTESNGSGESNNESGESNNKVE